ncbi:MAG: aminopeptidase [Spirochaetales bacterium]|nr:aminopeptidase [Spirochaetales bacterium]
MDNLINNYVKFISENKTERLCTQTSVRIAQENGYRDINTVDKLKAGDKVYYDKMGKSLILFNIGSDDISKGMNILGAHIDSPRLDAKQNPIYEDKLYKTGIVYLNTHYYGGIKKYQWVASPLAIYGVVVKADGTKVDVAIGDDPEDPVFCISDILPHIAQEQMKKTAADFIEGEKLDAILACYPNVKKYRNPEEGKYEPGDGKKKVLQFLEDKYGIKEDDFASAELELVPAGQARFIGFDKTLVLGYGQDDRVCAYTSLIAMVEGKAGNRTNCCILADKEEVGSNGATGMNSHLLDNAVAEVVARLDIKGNPELAVRRTLANSYMLSSDVNSAFDPLNPGLYDIYNSSFLGRGVVFNKYTGARGKSGASDANPEFIAKVRGKLYESEVYFQNAELSKVDTGGGGTIARNAAEFGMNVLDCGVSVMSMHAPWEITSAFDIEQAYKCYKAFLELA